MGALDERGTSDGDAVEGPVGPEAREGASERIRASWAENADAWTEAVRAHRIPSRRLGTDAAVVAACRRVLGARDRSRVLDVGCGEGWLARALAPDAAQVLGIDASAGLIERARAAADHAGLAFETVAYDELRSPDRVSGPFDLIVANYALLDDAVPATLRALGDRLAPGGRLVVQTVHPWTALGDAAYEDGWRVETFAAFERPFPSPMPWYYRTLASWVAAAGAARLSVETLEEPPGPEPGRPLSLLLTLARRP